MAEPTGSDVARALRRRMLMQDPRDPSKWEALQRIGERPGDYVRTDLDTAGAARYQQGGGFEVVPAQEYNAELQRISEAQRALRVAPETPAMPSAEEQAQMSLSRMSGTGAEGMVYADLDGPTLMPADAAMRRGLRVLTAEEAREMGQGMEESPTEEAAEPPEEEATETDEEGEGMQAVDEAGRRDRERILRNLEMGLDPLQRPMPNASAPGRGMVDMGALVQALRRR